MLKKMQTYPKLFNLISYIQLCFSKCVKEKSFVYYQFWPFENIKKLVKISENKFYDKFDKYYYFH